MRKILIVGLCSVLLAWPAPFAEAAQVGLLALAPTVTGDLTTPTLKDFHWKGRVERGGKIEIKGVNGGIRAERASGDEVEVTARKRARDSDPESVQIEVIEHEGGVTICAVYPSKKEDRPNECRPGRGGRMNTHNNDVRVDFTVRVPSGVNFVGKTVNGDVEAMDMRGDVGAYTVNGSIDVATTGLAEATTVNGSITASLGRADWDGTLDFSTVNGGIRLELPGDLDCELRVATVNGKISTDYAVTVSGRFSPRHLKGTIGKGGRELSLKTVNGSVELRRL